MSAPRSRRIPLLTAAVLAIVSAALLWLALRDQPESGTEVEPSTAARRPAEAPANVQPPANEPARPGPTHTLAPGRVDETREAVEARARWSAPLRGRIEDERTGEGVPQVLVATRAFASNERILATTDESGRFETPRAFTRMRLKLEAVDAFNDEALDERRWEHGGAAEECLWKVPIGPTYRIRIHGGDPGETWGAQVFETDGDGGERTWPPLEVQPHPSGEGLWIRHGAVHHEPHPRWRPALRVVNEAETWAGEAPLQSTLGVHPGTIHVVVAPSAGTIEGRVTDVDGGPVEALVLLLLDHPMYKDEDALRESGTDGGHFSFSRVPGGRHRILVSTDTRGVVRRRVESVPGQTTTYDVVLPDVVLAGNVAGALLAPPEADDPLALVRLESLDGRGTNLVQFTGFTFQLFGATEEEDGRSPFEFEDLPEGEYRLTVIPLDGRRYDRTTTVVRPPTEGVLFTTDDVDVEELTYELVVVDAATGEVVEGAVHLTRFGPFWSAEVDRADEMRVEDGPATIDVGWAVTAPGYLPTYVALADAERDGDTLYVEIALERGHGAALVVVDAGSLFGGAESGLSDIVPAPGLAGAEILVNGRVVGRSGPHGLALARSDGPIRSYDVHAPGWFVLTKYRFRSHEETPDGLGFVLMARD